MNKRSQAVALVSGAILCFVAGCKAASPDTEVDFVPIRTVETVEVPGETITNTVIPDSCITALRNAGLIADAGNKLYANGDKQIAIIGDARRTLANGGDLNRVANDQRDLQGVQVAHLDDMSSAVYRYQVAYDECKAEQE